MNKDDLLDVLCNFNELSLTAFLLMVWCRSGMSCSFITICGLQRNSPTSATLNHRFSGRN